MPFVRVTLDQTLVASVNTDGKNLVSVLISGSLVKDHAGDLSISGGTYGSDFETNHVIWGEHPLKTGQVVCVELLAAASEVGEGKTVEQMYPEYSVDAAHMPSRTEMISQIEAMPRLRTGFELRLSDQNDCIGTLTSEAQEIGFALSVLWTMNKGDKARVALHAYSIEAMRNAESGRYALQGELGVGSSLRCELVA